MISNRFRRKEERRRNWSQENFQQVSQHQILASNPDLNIGEHLQTKNPEISKWSGLP
jgi:hypothetical protein